MKTKSIFTNPGHGPASGATENSLAIGTRLSDFEITGIIGEGGFGIVYVAFDHSLQRTVAIKEYMPGAMAGRAADNSVTVRSERNQETFDIGLNSFINEARFLAQFDHPSLVKVYRYWEENKTAYMAMRYYDGRTIKDIVSNTPEIVTEEWCKFIFKQILEALETLYAMKILHRDVSPDNIIVQKNGEAVLLDFGSARQIIGDRTRGLTVILKPGYAPVEQYAGDASLEQGPWTDIYALSAVMYFAIVKEPPPTSIARMIKDPMIALRGRPALAKFSERFLAAIDRGLEVQAADRPQTIDDFRRLLAIGAYAGTRPRPEGATERVASRSGSSSSSSGSSSGSRSSSSGSSRSSSSGRTSSGRSSSSSEKTVNHSGLSSRERKHQRQLAAAANEANATKVVTARPGAVPERERTARKVAEDSEFATPSLPTSKRPMIVGATLLVAALAVGGWYTMSESKPPVVAPVPAAVVAAPAPATDPETMAWNGLKDDQAAGAEQLNAFVERYPTGKFAAEAKARLVRLSAAAALTASTTAASSASNTTAASTTSATPAASAPVASSSASALAADPRAATPTDTKPGEVKPADATDEAALVTTSFKLTIKPWGTIIVDGKDRGVSPPLKHIVLPAGRHKIRIVNPNFPEYATEVEVTKKRFGVIEHDFTTGR